MSDEILHEQADGVCTITFNRPAKKNAFTLAMYVRIVELLAQAAEDDEVRVVLLRGEGGSFTAGNDLMDFMNNPPRDQDTPVFKLLLGLAAYEKPIVAAVSGPAIGIGTTMLLHCDLVYAAENTRFAMPFVNLGLCPEGGSSLLLPRMMGHARAAELLMLGDKFTASTAHEVGIVSRVLPDGELDAHAREQARVLAAKAPESLRLTKSLLKAETRQQLRAVLKTEGDHFLKRLTSAEAREAFTAFFEKRPPDFTKLAKSS